MDITFTDDDAEYIMRIAVLWHVLTGQDILLTNAGSLAFKSAMQVIRDRLEDYDLCDVDIAFKETEK